MTPSPEMPDDSRLDEVAAEWLCERDTGFTPNRASEFAAWCAADPRHAAACRRVERTLALLDELPTVRAPLERRLRTLPDDRSQLVAFRRWAWLGAAAAVLLAGLVFWRWRPEPAAPTWHYATDRTVQRSVALPDGSVMDVNVDSDVTVRFTPAERHITLNRGEAHFQVAHKPDWPFIVTAGDVAVRAVGTAFEVRLTTEVVDVVVVEGKVQLGRKLAGNSPAAAEPPPVLLAGERAWMVRHALAEKPRIQGIDADSIRSLLTWQTPMVSFTDVPLRDVITRLNRHAGIQLALEDEEMGDRKIGGMIALDQIDAFVRLLEQDGEMVADRTTPGRITLRHRH
jgi:transmembrane sensor